MIFIIYPLGQTFYYCTAGFNVIFGYRDLTCLPQAGLFYFRYIATDLFEFIFFLCILKLHLQSKGTNLLNNYDIVLGDCLMFLTSHRLRFSYQGLFITVFFFCKSHCIKTIQSGSCTGTLSLTAVKKMFSFKSD